MKQKRKINIVTLGCSKNVVDSEYLMKQLDASGWQVLHNSNDADAKVVIINTCGFVADAKEESVDTILNFVEAKKSGLISKVFVMGCLSQRYRTELAEEIPDVDGFFGVSDLPSILSTLDTQYIPKYENRRMISTPRHYAYLKISEGCSLGCSFCAIPLIRGKHVSKPIPELVDQAKWLAEEGVKELILIAQDSTFYGKDIYGKRELSTLLKKLETVEGLEWIRVHYAYPAGFPLDVIDVMKSSSKICRYIDIPFQHISDRVLTAMRRGVNKNQTIELIEKLRYEIPEIALRTTFLVGHPGESDEDFIELKEFVRAMKFDRLGVFTFSPEEGTLSANLKDSISEEIKQERMQEIMEIQQGISLENNLSRVAKEYKVIVDRHEGEFYVGRTEFDSPEVDQEVLIKDNVSFKLKSGDFVNCLIESASDYDMFGSVVVR